MNLSGRAPPDPPEPPEAGVPEPPWEVPAEPPVRFAPPSPALASGLASVSETLPLHPYAPRAEARSAATSRSSEPACANLAMSSIVKQQLDHTGNPVRSRIAPHFSLSEVARGWVREVQKITVSLAPHWAILLDRCRAVLPRSWQGAVRRSASLVAHTGSAP